MRRLRRTSPQGGGEVGSRAEFDAQAAELAQAVNAFEETFLRIVQRHPTEVAIELSKQPGIGATDDLLAALLKASVVPTSVVRLERRGDEWGLWWHHSASVLGVLAGQTGRAAPVRLRDASVAAKQAFLQRANEFVDLYTAKVDADKKAIRPALDEAGQATRRLEQLLGARSVDRPSEEGGRE